MTGWSELPLCSREPQDVLSGGRERGVVVGKRTWPSAIALPTKVEDARRATRILTKPRLQTICFLERVRVKSGSWSESSAWCPSGWALLLGVLVENINHQQMWGHLQLAASRTRIWTIKKLGSTTRHYFFGLDSDEKCETQWVGLSTKNLDLLFVLGVHTGSCDCITLCVKRRSYL